MSFHSKSQYERIFQRWGFRKNRTKDEWKAIASHVQLAQESGAQIEVYVDDTLIPDTKIRKQTQRYSFLRTEERHAVSRRGITVPCSMMLIIYKS